MLASWPTACGPQWEIEGTTESDAPRETTNAPPFPRRPPSDALRAEAADDGRVGEKGSPHGGGAHVSLPEAPTALALRGTDGGRGSERRDTVPPPLAPPSSCIEPALEVVPLPAVVSTRRRCSAKNASIAEMMKFSRRFRGCAAVPPAPNISSKRLRTANGGGVEATGVPPCDTSCASASVGGISSLSVSVVALVVHVSTRAADDRTAAAGGATAAVPTEVFVEGPSAAAFGDDGRESSSAEKSPLKSTAITLAPPPPPFSVLLLASMRTLAAGPSSVGRSGVRVAASASDVDGCGDVPLTTAATVEDRLPSPSPPLPLPPSPLTAAERLDAVAVGTNPAAAALPTVEKASHEEPVPTVPTPCARSPALPTNDALNGGGAEGLTDALWRNIETLLLLPMSPWPAAEAEGNGYGREVPHPWRAEERGAAPIGACGG